MGPGGFGTSGFGTFNNNAANGTAFLSKEVLEMARKLS